MNRLSQKANRVVALLCAAWMALGIVPAQAAMMAAEYPLPAQSADEAKLVEARRNLLNAMVEAGVDESAARERVASLPSADALHLAGELESLPAGGDHGAGFWAVIGAIFGFLFGWMLGDRHHHGHGHGHGHGHH